MGYWSFTRPAEHVTRVCFRVDPHHNRRAFVPVLSRDDKHRWITWSRPWGRTRMITDCTSAACISRDEMRHPLTHMKQDGKNALVFPAGLTSPRNTRTVIERQDVRDCRDGSEPSPVYESHETGAKSFLVLVTGFQGSSPGGSWLISVSASRPTLGLAVP